METVSSHGLFFFLPPSFFFKENCQLLPPGVHFILFIYFFGGVTQGEGGKKKPGLAGFALTDFPFFFPPFVPLQSQQSVQSTAGSSA